MSEDKADHYFVRIRNYVEDKIKSGEFVAGSQIPTEIELAGQFGVSRLTVKRALMELVERKLLYRVKGKGTFVQHDVQDQLSLTYGIPDVRQAPIQKCRDIAVIMPDMYSSYANTMVHSIYHSLHEEGYGLRLYLTKEDYEKEKSAILDSLSQGVSGMIIFPARRQTYNEEILKLALQSFPHVLIDRYLRGIDNYCVYSENFGGAYETINRLVGKGHRHIAVISPTKMETTSVEDRISGVQAAVTDNMDAHIRIYNFNLLEDQFGSMLTESPDEEIIDQVVKFLSKNKKVTAAFAMNLSAAGAVVYAAERMGITVPEQLQVVTFDKLEYPKLLKVPLSYVEQDAIQLGFTASRTLLSIIAGETPPKVQKIPTKIHMS